MSLIFDKTNNPDYNLYYRMLKNELTKNKLFIPDYQAYIIRICWLIPMYIVGWIALLFCTDLLIRIFLTILLGFSCVQSAAIAHEAGHNAITTNKRYINFIGHFCMTFLMGSSFSSWLCKHSRHHAHANSKLDPDIKPLVFAFSENDARAARGFSQLMTQYQHYLIWPMASLMGFSFKIGSLIFIFRNIKKTKIDQIVLALHALTWIIFPSIVIGFYSSIINYLLITIFAGLHLSFIFLTNHVGQPYAEQIEPRSFLHRQIICARNLSHSWILTRICNGLNSHIEHHLFSNVSFSKLHVAREATKNLCMKLQIPYHEVSILTAFKEFHQHNRKMAAAVRKL